MNAKMIVGGSVLAMMLVSGCGKGDVDPKSVEDKLMGEGKTTEGHPVTFKKVSCPSGQPVKAGTRFTCTATLPDGDEIVYNIELLGDGKFSFASDTKVLTMAGIGDSIEKQVHEHADVVCPATVIVVKPGKTFTCDVKGAEDKLKKVQISVNANGTYDWKAAG